MALIQNVFDQVTDPSLGAVLQEEAHKGIKTLIKETATFSPYAMPTRTKALLEKYAIPHNPFSVKLHTHAAAKVIENDLYKAASFYLTKDPTTFLFMKRSKLQYFRRRGDSDIFINADMVAKDLARYPPETIYAHCPPIKTPRAFIGDSLHHFPVEFLTETFNRSDTLELMVATIVLPPEASMRFRPLFPEVYDITYTADRFLYRPGGLSGGEYEHCFKDLAWLQVGHITTPNFTLTVDRVESKAANHLLIIRRGKLKLPKYRSYDLPEPLVRVPQVFRPKMYNASKPIPKAKANAWIMYVKSVGNASIRDVWAKLRQSISSADLHEYDPQEILMLTNYFYLLGKLESVTNFQTLLEDGVIKRVFRPLMAKLQQWKFFFTGQTAFMQLHKALQLQEVNLVFKVTSSFSYLPPEEDSMEVPPEIREVLAEAILSLDISSESLEDRISAAPAVSAISHPEAIHEPVPDPSAPSPAPPAEAVTAPATLPWDAWLHVLNSLGFRGDQVQRDPNGLVIYPITNLRTLPPATVDHPIWSKLKEIGRPPTFFWPDIERAAAFARDVMANKTGAILPKQSLEWKTTLKRKCKEEAERVALCVIHGAGGSGKSKVIQDFMRANPDSDIIVVLPTNELRADWKRKLPAHDSDVFMTFENALLVPKGSCVVMDDYTKLPKGFIEAFIQMSPALELLILTGDPRQSEHHESSEGNTINDLASASDVFNRHCHYYINATHRNKRDLANALGVYSEVEGTTTVSYSKNLREGFHNLTPSQMKQRNYASLGRRASTYAGCQGITAPRVQIIVDQDTFACSNQVLYTALSRAVDEIHFCNTMSDERAFWAKLDSTPYIKAILSLHRERATTSADPTEEAPREPEPPITHIAVTNRVELTEEITEDLMDKHDREIFSPDAGHTNCIQTQDPFIQAFQHQQAKDEPLFWATIEKRIKTSTVRDNWQEFKTKRPLGDVLWMAYKDAMGLPAEPIKFDPDLWWSCVDEVQKKYLSKPLHMIKNASLRQSPDFDKNKIQLFLKSQWVKKNEKIGLNPVKPGQTIAAFFQSTVMLYGAMARYMRRVRDQYTPAHIIINCEKDQPQMSAWVKQHWNFDCQAYTNDFEAFDQSQDGAMLQFEMLKIAHHDMPEDLAASYLELKLDAKIFLGTLAVMRLTGEGPTFDANTECNIAYTHARFVIPPGTAQMYAGDDCALNCAPQERESFKPLLEKFTLKAKPLTFTQAKGSWPEFCGNLLTPKGYLKHPRKTWASLEKARRAGKQEFHACVDNYANDVLPTYRLGDDVHEIFTEHELAYHFQTIRSLITEGKTQRFVRERALNDQDEGFFLYC
nr:MAG: replicase [Xinjiang alphaflexivirus 1]